MLSLLMLQHALAPSIADAHARSRLPVSPGDNPASLPYLKVTGALPLRFEEPAPPPPDLSSRPAAGAPPQPPFALTAEAVPAAIMPVEVAQPKPDVIAPAAVLPPPTKPADITPSILPDDTRVSTRAEDFLPFFQFPGSGNGDVTLTPPRPAQPGQLPPSSATYQQK
jgi:hypothetical protein